MSEYSAEIISIGNEVLSGKIINNNAFFISRELKKAGFLVKRHTTIPDDSAIIMETFAESMACVPLVIATGGLGPTLDDVTRQAAADLFNVPLEYNETIAKDLQTRYGKGLTSLEDQSMQPKKALILPNHLGTASGLLFYDGHSALVLLPGVPVEMQALFYEEVLPNLKRLFPAVPYPQEAWLYFANLYESQVNPLLHALQTEYPTINLGIYPANGLLSVHITGESHDVETAQKALQQEFGEYAYVSHDGRLETAIQEYFTQHQLTLSLAESCTGGSIAGCLTALPGASKYFLGGVIAYSDKLKHHLLEVPIDMIQKYGAVSEEVAQAMATGIQKLTNSNYAVATTGIAGPTGGSEQKPVGTVFVAIKTKDKSISTYSLHAYGSRTMIIERTIHFALGKLHSIIK